MGEEIKTSKITGWKRAVFKGFSSENTHSHGFKGISTLHWLQEGM